MSELNHIYGYIAVLQNPLNENEREDIQDKFYNEDSELDITYDGKCVWMNLNEDKHEIMFTHVGNNYFNDVNDKFNDELLKYNIHIKPSTITPFNCMYYNGCDCPINMLTPEQVLNGYKD